MDGMPGFYAQGYAGMDPQQSMDGYAQDDSMNTAMDTTGLGQAQTLHQIINQNNEELMRRRNTFQPQYRQNSPDRSRRASMLEFGSSMNGGDLANFQFDPDPNEPDVSMSNSMSNMMPINKPLDPRRVRSREDLALNTRFSQMNTSFDPLAAVDSYNPALMASTSGGVDSASAFMNHMNMMDFGPMGGMTEQAGAMQEPMFSDSPMDQSFTVPYPPAGQDPRGGSMNHQMHNSMNNPMATMAQNMPTMAPTFRNTSQHMGDQTPISGSMTMTAGLPPTMASPLPVQHSNSRRASGEMPTAFSSNGSVTPNSRSMNPPGLPHMQQVTGPQGPQPQFSKYTNAYSSSGFDMLGVLMRVATRPRPEINIGPVDLSCAFVVCDLDKFDLPIVYCSEMFERLTGYTKHEILGRNCRFLQAPDGKVQSGVKRKYVDDNSVLYLKNQISQRAEGQLSLINYRKGGQPFMNLLTMIPIQFDSEDYKFYVGFQVDLVEQPGSVSRRNPDGSYEINYNRSSLPAYTLPAPPDLSQGLQEMGQTIPKDEVSKVLASFGRGDGDLSKRIWDKVLLENTDDVVHVLSLKGLFLYLSPASRRVLEYDTGELVGTALSSVCHPSDIVPVTRELKDSSNGNPVNVVYRIRRKHSGYTWFEAHGALHTEQGKGKKCIILVGRERPVYALDKNDLSSEGATGESELWSKISTSGMFLHVSSTSRVMLDRLPEDLVGTSMQSLMRPDSRKDFARTLEKARTGEKVSLRHDLQNRRGQVLYAQTTIYSGDAKPGFKPTFLLAQTRLLKMTRAALLTQKSTSQSPRTDQASMGSATPITNVSGPSGTLRRESSSLSSDSHNVGDGMLTHAGGHGLPLGNQDESLASEDNVFDELKTTRSSSWQFELRQMERQNRLLSEELQGLLSRKKKRKRRKGLGQLEKDCANCHTRVTPEWRRGPSGQRDLCNSCGLRWAKQQGRVSPRKTPGHSDRGSTSPAQVTPADRSNGKTVDSSSTATGMQIPGTINGTIVSGQGLQATKANDTLWRGAMPPKIDEADEPPGPNVLPT
ncbi:hypothetical protein LTR99_010578 [Exophiala xenobiotica]|uniref:White collar 1 protein n=1 Tax=Vermiconidia calcicola TaxID=1690605 RepID=A0AAV9PX73_9PEZI|nr:hypothetical protein LTR96_006919 [Exophiala xenobiotica]KAK5528735.1 hypothetical protein LTR25_010348 [Vermiconidia calcicola]KAK5546159.1 hypothetical protein LTR23_003966 [Chaetothyriales sp. CCFEE 6169]KAK5292434.1 hypothetical protein LTR99_010578 [Exophiala xenobiotica]KAK5336447.1 hypothetical protein LTR98_007777 [Exophiala xenobiotica]